MFRTVYNNSDELQFLGEQLRQFLSGEGHQAVPSAANSSSAIPSTQRPPESEDDEVQVVEPKREQDVSWLRQVFERSRRAEEQSTAHGASEGGLANPPALIGQGEPGDLLPGRHSKWFSGQGMRERISQWKRTHMSRAKRGG
eukprot:4114527-Alexandrium_andersonii.AAC.1